MSNLQEGPMSNLQEGPKPGQRMPNGTVCQGNHGNGSPARQSKLRRSEERADAFSHIVSMRWQTLDTFRRRQDEERAALPPRVAS